MSDSAPTLGATHRLRVRSEGWTSWLREDTRRFDLVAALLVVTVGTALILGSPQQFDTGWPDAAAGVGAFLLLLVRRWAPILLLAVALAASTTHAALLERPSVALFAALGLLATAAVRLDRGPAILLGAITGPIAYANALLANPDISFGDGRAIIAFVWVAAAIGMADAVRSWRRYRASAEDQVRSAVLAAEAQTRQQVTEERLEIARELHDLLAHNLSVMNVQTGAALHLLRSDPDKAEEALTAARDAGRGVLDELRELLGVLRNDDGESSEPRSSLPTVDTLNQLVDTMRSAGLRVAMTERGEPRPLAPAVSLAAFRICQEALTNAAKHGDGSATVTVEWGRDQLTLTVVNPIVHAAPSAVNPTGGHGLVGMRERATAIGGSLETGIDGGSFRVQAGLPVLDVLADTPGVPR